MIACRCRPNRRERGHEGPTPPCARRGDAGRSGRRRHLRAARRRLVAAGARGRGHLAAPLSRARLGDRRAGASADRGPGRLGLAIVISVVASTHLVWLLSLAGGGYGRGVVFAAAGLLSVPLALAAWRGSTSRLPARRPIRRSPPSRSPGSRPPSSAACLDQLWRVTPNGVSSGGSNWSDLGVHLSIAQSLNAGNFPPQVPYFAGEPLVYHWFAGLPRRDRGARGRHLLRPRHGRAVGAAGGRPVAPGLLAGAGARPREGCATWRVLAAVIAVFGGGLGYIRFFGDLTAAGRSPLSLIAANSYDNQWLTGWPFFRIPSVMGTGLLAHRATTVGLPMLIGAVLLLVHGLPTARARLAGARDRPWLIGVAGVLGALLAPFHFFFFPVFPLLALAVGRGGRPTAGPQRAAERRPRPGAVRARPAVRHRAGAPGLGHQARCSS